MRELHVQKVLTNIEVSTVASASHDEDQRRPLPVVQEDWARMLLLDEGQRFIDAFTTNSPPSFGLLCLFHGPNSPREAERSTCLPQLKTHIDERLVVSPDYKAAACRFLVLPKQGILT